MKTCVPSYFLRSSKTRYFHYVAGFLSLDTDMRFFQVFEKNNSYLLTFTL